MPNLAPNPENCMSIEHKLQIEIKALFGQLSLNDQVDAITSLFLENILKQHDHYENNRSRTRLSKQYANSHFINYLATPEKSVKKQAKCDLDSDTITLFLKRDYVKNPPKNRISKNRDYFAVVLGYHGWLSGLSNSFDPITVEESQAETTQNQHLKEQVSNKKAANKDLEVIKGLLKSQQEELLRQQATLLDEKFKYFIQHRQKQNFLPKKMIGTYLNMGYDEYEPSERARYYITVTELNDSQSILHYPILEEKNGEIQFSKSIYTVPIDIRCMPEKGYLLMLIITNTPLSFMVTARMPLSSASEIIKVKYESDTEIFTPSEGYDGINFMKKLDSPALSKKAIPALLGRYLDEATFIKHVDKLFPEERRSILKQIQQSGQPMYRGRNPNNRKKLG